MKQKNEDLEVAEDLIKDLNKSKDSRTLLKEEKQSIEDWQDYNKVKGEIK